MAEEPKAGAPTLISAFQAVLAAAGTGLVAQHVLEKLWPHLVQERPAAAAIAGIGVALLLAAAGSTRSRLQFLSSRHLAVTALAVLAVQSILGTLIVQAAPEAALESRYGSVAIAIRTLLLDDVFHSMPFAFVLGTAAAGLALSFVRKKTLGLKRAGVLAAHGGCLLVLAGAATQSLVGVEGRIDLHEGESTSRLVSTTPGGSEEIPLGFSIRLDDFRLLSYEPEIRLRVFSAGDEGQQLVASFDPADAVRDPSLLTRFGVRVTDYWPDHRMGYDVKPAAEGEQGIPALGIRVEGGGIEWLFDTGRIEDSRLAIGEGGWLAFFWDARRAEDFAGAGPSPHVLTTQQGAIRVAVGSEYPEPGTAARIRIIAFLNDLVVDPSTREAYNRSDEPRNPALRVEMLDEEGVSLGQTWLFANHPDFHGTDPSKPLAGLRYLYEPMDGEHEGWVACGEKGTVRRVGTEISLGLEEASRDAIVIAGRKVKVERVLGSAIARAVHSTRSTDPLDPAIRVEDLSGRLEPMILPEGFGADLGGGIHLVLARKEDSDRDYLSDVSVVEGERIVRRETIEVNHPLSHRGFTLYQSDFDPRDLAFSGFRVSRDPGLPVVYTGFAACVVGILVAFYLAPRLRRRVEGEP